MIATIPTAPDEETPLLGGQQVSTIGEVTESEPGASTLTSPSNRGSESKLNKKPPFPWAQFSIVLFLQLAEPLTSQVIYPVSFSTLLFALAKLDAGRGFYCTLNDLPFLLFHSLHPKSV